MDSRAILAILNEELALATGCTEPAAIAFAAATAASRLGEDLPERIAVLASGNMIKNAMAAGIPGIDKTGAAYAAAIGASGGDPAAGLLVFERLRPGAIERAERLVREGRVSLGLADTPERLYIDVAVAGRTREARVVISGAHTRVALIEENGRAVERRDDASGSAAGAQGGKGLEAVREPLSLRAIYGFIETVDTKDPGLDIVRESIRVNGAIAEAGLREPYGLRIGRALRARQAAGLACRDLVNEAVCLTAAGADARMAGAPYAVVSNSGSGNQGITATMPVVAAGTWLGAGDERVLRAVTLSHLVAIHAKSGFGRLSAFCGAAVAAMGAACGVTYLLGGDEAAVERAVQNMVGSVTGMICDGAKADCALKISTCVNAAMQAALLAVEGVRVDGAEGINEEDAERSLANFAALSADCSEALDARILAMMTSKGS